ncbi:hypothetical protein IL306_013623 [Fusarium sp. DS 682]|nr:hypothetical protein IL306_013623 [Fusarium sp. DS 682]
MTSQVHRGTAAKILPKIAPKPLLKSRSSETSPMQQAHHPQDGGQLQRPRNTTPDVNPSTAPGLIPATTHLDVWQDGNSVHWIAFQYSRNRVEMEYTIRCDIKSVNTDELSPEFKQENCIYLRTYCPDHQYRGNRLVYETDCNRIGWALAKLNPVLQGKRGLIQRAVDSWRNSGVNPKLLSRRVRRMAKHTKECSAKPLHLDKKSSKLRSNGVYTKTIADRSLIE